MTRALALALLAGCGGGGGLEAAPGVPFGLEVGEAAVVEGAEVRFLEVVEDSRCPDGAQCAWAGTARVRVAVDGAEAVLSVPHPGSDAPEPAAAAVGGLGVEVRALTPYPSVEPSDEPVRLTLSAAE